MDKTATVFAVIGVVLTIVTIVAIYQGPISALKIQRKLDEERESRNRKLTIFRTLISNRVIRLSPAYVQALNLIDVEFTGDSAEEQAVREAWKELHDLYSSFKTTPNAEDKSNDLNATLLSAIGKVLGYNFDKVYLKKGGYYPEFLVNTEQEQHALRRLLLEVLDGTGRRKIPVATFETKFPDLVDNKSKKTGNLA